MAVSTSDVSNVFSQHNHWKDPACKKPSKICTRISVFQSGTGKEEWLAFLTATNGFWNASAIWEAIHARAILKWGGQRSVDPPILE